MTTTMGTTLSVSSVDTQPSRMTMNLVIARSLASIALVLLPGCTADSESRYGTVPAIPDSPSAGSVASKSTTSNSRTDDEMTIAQYRTFWTVALPRAYAAEPAQKPAMLESVVDRPLMNYLLQRIARLQKSGRTSYGHDEPRWHRVEKLSTSPRTVLVRGCLDSSGTGVMEMRSGRKLTVGVPNNPVLVKLRRDSGGVWLIVGFHFPGGQCR